MDKFYGKVVFETAVPVDNPDNLILFLNSIEFQKPELLRLDFATIRTSVSKNPDGTCILTANCFDFDYDTYKADYEKLALEPDEFTYDYFKSISNESLKLTEILAECEDKTEPHKQLPLRLKSVRLYFDHHGGDEYLNFEEYATAECCADLLDSSPLDIMDIVSVLSEYGDHDGFCESFANALFDSMRTDDEKPERIGHYLFKAIKDNSFDDFLIAICGWSLETLMKQALIIPDKESQFHDEIIEAKIIGLWDDDYRDELSCKVNTKTREVFEIEHNFDDPKGKEDFDDFKEFVSIDGVEFPLIPKDEYDCGNKLAFWYGEDE